MKDETIMLTLTASGVEFISRFEKFIASEYRDAVGERTIGYGHRIFHGEHFPSRITRGAALDLLIQDATRVAQPVENRLMVPLEPHQADALLSLAFNVGGYAVAGSVLLQRINAGRMDEAGDEFLRWAFAGGRVLRGLVTRREAERKLFKFSDYSRSL